MEKAPGNPIKQDNVWADGQLATRMEAEGFSNFVVARMSPKDLREALGIPYPLAVMLCERAKEQYPDPLLQAIRDMQHNTQIMLRQIAQHQIQVRDEIQRLAPHAAHENDTSQDSASSAFRNQDTEGRTDCLVAGYSHLANEEQHAYSAPSAYGSQKLENKCATSSCVAECPTRAQKARESMDNEPVLSVSCRTHSPSNTVAAAPCAPVGYPSSTTRVSDGTLRYSNDAQLLTPVLSHAIPAALSPSSGSDSITTKVSTTTEVQNSKGGSVENENDLRSAYVDNTKWEDSGVQFVRSLACINLAEVPYDDDLDEAGRRDFFISFVRDQVLVALHSSTVRQELLLDDVYSYLLSLKAQSSVNSSLGWTEPFSQRALQYLRSVCHLSPEPFNARAYAHASQLNAQRHLDIAEDEAQLRSLLEAESLHTVLSWDQYWELLLTAYFFSCLSINDANHPMTYPRTAYFINDVRLPKEQRAFSDRQMLNISSALLHLLRVVLDMDVALSGIGDAAPALVRTLASTRASVSASASAPMMPPPLEDCKAGVPCADAVVSTTLTATTTPMTLTATTTPTTSTTPTTPSTPTTPTSKTRSENTSSVPETSRPAAAACEKVDETEPFVAHSTCYYATADEGVTHGETHAGEPAVEDADASFQDAEEGNQSSLSSVGYFSVSEVSSEFRMSTPLGLCVEDANAILHQGDAAVKYVSWHIDGEGTSLGMRPLNEDLSVEFHAPLSVYSKPDEEGEAETALISQLVTDNLRCCESRDDSKNESGYKGQDDFAEDARKDAGCVQSRAVRTWRVNACYRRRRTKRDAFLRRRILFRWRAEVGFILMGRRVTRKYIENCSRRCLHYWQSYVAQHMRPLRSKQQRTALRMAEERDGMLRTLMFGEWWNVKEREALHDAEMAFQVGEITERYAKQHVLVPLLRAWHQMTPPALARLLSARKLFIGRLFRAWSTYAGLEMQEMKDKLMALQLKQRDKIMCEVMREWLSSCVRFPTPSKLYGNFATRNTVAQTPPVSAAPLPAQHTPDPRTTPASATTAPPPYAPPPPPSAAVCPPSDPIPERPVVSVSFPQQVKPKEAPSTVVDNTYPIHGLPHQGEAHCYVGGAFYESCL